MQCNRRTCEIHESKRTESESECFARYRINLRSSCYAFLFSKRSAILNCSLKRFFRCCLRRNDLNQSVLGRVVEEMQSYETVGTTGCLSQGVDRKRRGVRCEDCSFITGIVQSGEHSCFDIKIFEHRLDDQIGVCCSILSSHDIRDSTKCCIHFIF